MVKRDSSASTGKKTLKSSKKTIKKQNVKKVTAAKKSKPKTKTVPVKKTQAGKLKKKTKKIVKNTKKPAPLSTPSKKQAANDKPAPSQPKNLSLPEGSVFQQTGHRRPLIVFPKQGVK